MYRIREKQCFNWDRWFVMRRDSDSFGKSKFYVQYKCSWLFFWVTITSAFDSQEQAENYIKLILDVKANKG